MATITVDEDEKDPNGSRNHTCSNPNVRADYEGNLLAYKRFHKGGK